MRWVRGTALFATAVAVIGLLALNWRAQLQTQQKLDALAASIAERSAENAPVPAVGSTAVMVPPVGAVPRELDKITLPPYTIEAPDQLTIEVVVKDPKNGAVDRLPTQPISGAFAVRPDGTVGLGFWGSVSVTGMTSKQASEAVRNHLAGRVKDVSPEDLVVAVGVLTYNSKRYYVITAGVGGGEQVFPFPVTGSETVLDAVANVSGLHEVAVKGTVRVTRRVQGGGGTWEQLPVDWVGITQRGVTHTNYQILPGDRVHVTRASN